MKKTSMICLLAGALTLFITSCSSTKNVQSAPDTYEDTPAIAEESSDGLEEDNGSEIKSKSDSKSTSAKKKKNAIEEFFTFGNKDDYAKYYDISIYEKDITGMKERRATTLIRTDDYMAGWGSYYVLAYYIVQFDAAARKQLISAINAYNTDFEEKNLRRKGGKKTERAYGKISYRLDWGTISHSTPNMGTGEGYMGYEFVKGSPYFTIRNYPFNNKHYDRIGEATTRESMSLVYYFTRAQLKELANFLSDENINQRIAEMSANYVSSDSDEYQD